MEGGRDENGANLQRAGRGRGKYSKMNSGANLNLRSQRLTPTTLGTALLLRTHSSARLSER